MADLTVIEGLKEPDEMGVWSEAQETVWLPRSLYPARTDAIRWAIDQWSVGWLDVRCLSRWMRYEPRVVGGFTLDGRTDPGWSEDWWVECDRDDPQAFRVWRLEAV
jgi:hypothetical protein